MNQGTQLTLEYQIGRLRSNGALHCNCETFGVVAIFRALHPREEGLIGVVAHVEREFPSPDRVHQVDAALAAESPSN